MQEELRYLTRERTQFRAFALTRLEEISALSRWDKKGSERLTLGKALYAGIDLSKVLRFMIVSILHGQNLCTDMISSLNLKSLNIKQ